jgi:hypothetical protein
VILRDDLPQENATPARSEFLAEVAASEYAHGAVYKQAGVGAHLAALLLRIIPKIGKLKALATKAPSVETENLFLASVVAAEGEFRALLRQVATDSADRLKLRDLDLDTGRQAIAGESHLVDRTYAWLLARLVDQQAHAPVEIVQRVLAFFAAGGGTLTAGEFAKVQANERELRAHYSGF